MAEREIKSYIWHDKASSHLSKSIVVNNSIVANKCIVANKSIVVITILHCLLSIGTPNLSDTSLVVEVQRNTAPLRRCMVE